MWKYIHTLNKCAKVWPFNQIYLAESTVFMTSKHPLIEIISIPVSRLSAILGRVSLYSTLHSGVDQLRKQRYFQEKAWNAWSGSSLLILLLKPLEFRAILALGMHIWRKEEKQKAFG